VVRVLPLRSFSTRSFRRLALSDGCSTQTQHDTVGEPGF
jgi:hypothetical protein